MVLAARVVEEMAELLAPERVEAPVEIAIRRCVCFVCDWQVRKRRRCFRI